MSTKVMRKVADILAPIMFFSFMIGVLGMSYQQSHPHIEELPSIDIPSSLISEFPMKREMVSILDEIPPLLETPVTEVSAEPEMLMDAFEVETSSEVDHILTCIDEITSARYPNLDPELIKAIVQRESRYDPTQVNRSTGVVGLMQINPKWHSARAKELGVDDLSDPYGNILVGCDLLSELMSEYPRDYALNVYAGGFDYANQYRTRISPVVSELNSIMAQFRSGQLVPGGD